MLNFEHELIVNPDPAQSPLTAAQLWQGLLWRARRPDHFLPGLQSVDILVDHAFGMERQMDFGELQIRDRVILEPPDAAHFIVREGAGLAGSSLSIEILQGPLRLKFHYQRPTVHARELNVNAFLQSAYQDADEQMLDKLRELANRGELDGHRQEQAPPGGTGAA